MTFQVTLNWLFVGNLITLFLGGGFGFFFFCAAFEAMIKGYGSSGNKLFWIFYGFLGLIVALTATTNIYYGG